MKVIKQKPKTVTMVQLVGALLVTAPFLSLSVSAQEPGTENLGTSTSNFTGSPITLQVKDADVRDVLRMVSEASGFNIIVHPNVQGKLTLNLEQVPWDQALDVVMKTNGLLADRNKSVLRVMPRDVFLEEKSKELDSKRIAADAAPKVTRIFPVSYVDLAQLAKILESFAQAQTKNPGGASVAASVIADTSNNSVIVRDSAEGVERIRKMIELLDVPTPQVMVEAKVVEASESFNKDLNGWFGMENRFFGLKFNNPADSLLGSSGGMTFGSDARFAIFNGGTRLQAMINMSERTEKVKVVSSPKLVVLSGKSATISQSTSDVIPVATQTAGVGTIATYQQINADTRLTVTPRVTNDGSIFMKLDLMRGVLKQGTQPIVEPRSILTDVIVDSGSTLVVGGVYMVDDTQQESGVPGLREMPLLGWLFGGKGKALKKTELMFFITPRVLNPKKANVSTTVN